MKRLVGLFVVPLLLIAACGSSSKSSTGTSASGSSGASSGGAVTVQVDARPKDFNFGATEYYPNELTVAPGTDVVFHENFSGEPHTVAFGAPINQLAKLEATLTPEQQNGPPPPEAQALFDKIPQLIDFQNADFSHPDSIAVNQAGAQPCVLAANESPGATACANQKPGKFDGTEALWNTGVLSEDQNVKLSIAENTAPGDYTFICLFHGPEMRGTLHVVAPGSSGIESAADVKAAGDKQLQTEIDQTKTALDSANSTAAAGQVKAGAGPENSSAGALVFAPAEVSVPVGGSVTWDLSFHTVSFNAPQDATPFLVKGSDGAWKVNGKSIAPQGYTPPPPPSSDSASSDQPPVPFEVDGGKYDGKGFFSSGSLPSDVVHFTLTFTTAGTYKYVCLLHPKMEGTIKVG